MGRYGASGGPAMPLRKPFIVRDRLGGRIEQQPHANNPHAMGASSALIHPGGLRLVIGSVRASRLWMRSKTWGIRGAALMVGRVTVLWTLWIRATRLFFAIVTAKQEKCKERRRSEAKAVIEVCFPTVAPLFFGQLI
jgi:hypothetical protein